MDTLCYIVSSAKKDIKSAKTKLVELLRFDELAECTINLYNRDEIEKVIKEVDNVYYLMDQLVKK